jgi:hypothetical protein
MLKRLIPIVGLIAILVGSNQLVAHACFYGCIRVMTPNDGLQSADVVFAGRAIAANQKAWRISHIEFERRPPFLHLEALDRRRTVFEVTTVWKGDIFAKISVTQDGTCAGYPFNQGEEYIVYANWIGGELRTNMCLRNNKLSDACEDLAAFGAGKPPAPNPSLVADYIRAMIAALLLLSLLGWAAWYGRRKYGVQKS